MAAAEPGDHAVKKRREDFSANNVSLSICEIEIISLFVTQLPCFLDHSCPRAPLAKLAQLTPESSIVLVIALRWKPSTK